MITVTNVTLAEIEHIRALDDLKKLYPSIFDQYDMENLKLAEKLSLLKQINDQSALDNANENKDRANSLKGDIEKTKKDIEVFKRQGWDTGNLQKKLDEQQRDLVNITSQIAKDATDAAQAEFDKKPVEFKVQFYKDGIDEAVKKRDALLASMNDKGDFDPSVTFDQVELRKLNEQIEKYSANLSSLNTVKADTSKNKDYWEKEKKYEEDTLAALDVSQKASKEGNGFVDESQNADQVIK